MSYQTSASPDPFSIRLFDILTQTAVVCLIFIVIFDFQVILSDGHITKHESHCSFLSGVFDEFCSAFRAADLDVAFSFRHTHLLMAGRAAEVAVLFILECTGSASEESDDAVFQFQEFLVFRIPFGMVLGHDAHIRPDDQDECQGVDKGLRTTAPKIIMATAAHIIKLPS